MALYNTDQLATIAAKIQHVKFGMFTTLDDHQQLSSRPLTQQQIDADGQMWFFVSNQAEFTQDLATHPAVNVSFADTGDSLYVSVAGQAELLHDRQRAAELWNPLLKAWFPAGLDDPHLALIKVRIQSAEYWDAGSSKMKQFFEIAKAAITGDAPRDLGEHGAVHLQ